MEVGFVFAQDAYELKLPLDLKNATWGGFLPFLWYWDG